jgi:hypothetical protein
MLEVIDPEDPGRRYELCRHPFTAQRETTTRQNLLEVTRKAWDQIAGAKRKSTQEKIGARGGRVLQKYKLGKFVQGDVREGRLSWQFDEEKIAAELLLDGCYVITTDAQPERLDSQKTVEAYKRLRLVELAFRNLKTVQWEVRPVFHKTDDRIRAHVFLCMLAYYVQWHMNQRLQPLFASDGQGKHREWTFDHVIARLAAIRREKVHLVEMHFHPVSAPESDQQRILDLLGTRL